MKEIHTDDCSVKITISRGWTPERGDRVTVVKIKTLQGQSEPCAKRRLETYVQGLTSDTAGEVKIDEKKVNGHCLLDLFVHGTSYSPKDLRRLSFFKGLAPNQSKEITCPAIGRCVSHATE